MSEHDPIHVVVVEDDKDTAFLLMNQLTRNPRLRAVHIAEPKQAMTRDVWDFNDDSIAMGIIDLMMPGTTGVDVAKWVKAHVPGVPLLALSALIYEDGKYDQHDPVAIEAVEVFDRVMSKPYNPRDLIGAIVAMVDDG